MLITRLPSPLTYEFGHVYAVIPEEIYNVSFQHSYAKHSERTAIIFDMIYTSLLEEIIVYEYQYGGFCIHIRERSGAMASFSFSSEEYNGMIMMAENFAGKSIDEITYGNMSYA